MLEDGTSTMVDETKDMDTMITGKIDEMLAQITGSDVELTSFVSEENTQVKSVQFVIKTAGIQAVQDTQAAAEAPQQLTFWQKLMKLFGR
jgi:putative membrane protein